MLPDILRRAELLAGSAEGEIAQRLAELTARLRRPEAGIVFGGRFSSGKSSLINALLGRPLLPTGDYPETGVPCWIRSGRSDLAVARTGSGTAALRLDTGSIAEQVSLVDASGEYRRHVRRVERIELTLAGAPIAAGVTWVDSPGIDDSPAMNERAARAAAGADLLIWVIDSRQPLSETEQAFLKRHMSRYGAGGVVFVVNVFLPEDTPAAWERVLAERETFLRKRVESAFDPAPDVVFVSARGCAGDPSGYGGPRLRALLDAIGDATGDRVLAARLEHAGMSARLAAEHADDLVRREQARLDERRRDVADRQARHTRRERAFRQALARAVAGCYARHGARAERGGPAVAAGIEKQSLARDGAYGAALTAAIDEAATGLAAELGSVTEALAAEHGFRPPPAAALAAVRQRLRPGELTVEVPGNAASLAAGAGAAVGATLGTLLFPGVGTVVGGMLGGLMGAGKDADTAAARDVAQAKANALEAGSAASARLAGTQAEVGRLLLEACRPAEPPPGEPDDSGLTGSRQLRDGLRELSRSCLAAAGSRLAS